MKPLRIVQFGLGPIGRETARLALNKRGMTLVGAIDIDEKIVGRDAGEVLELPESLGFKVESSAEAVLTRLKPDVVLHTTSSFLDRIEDQLMACIEAGAHVVSSTEELFYPYHRDAGFCKRIDAAAKAQEVAVVGTGVNPGFVLDVFPLFMTGVCTEVKSIKALRVSNAGIRRGPLQRKVGAGLSEAQFMDLVEQGKLGHIGLLESLLAIADGMGWKPDEIDEKVLPVIAEKDVLTPFVDLKKGRVAGIRHTCVAHENGKKIIDLELQMYVGAGNEHDRVWIEGTPPIVARIETGVKGDIATVAAVVNTAARIASARPGLRTMLDMDLPRACC